MFISFANFYQHFIQSFNRITVLLILLLKAIESSNLALKAFGADKNKVVEVDGKANKIIMNLSKNNKSRNLTYMPNMALPT